MYLVYWTRLSHLLKSRIEPAGHGGCVVEKTKYSGTSNGNQLGERLVMPIGNFRVFSFITFESKKTEKLFFKICFYSLLSIHFIEVEEEYLVYWTQWLSHLLKSRIEPTSANFTFLDHGRGKEMAANTKNQTKGRGNHLWWKRRSTNY